MAVATVLRDEFAWLDATAQAELIRRRDVAAIELVEAAIERIEALNPHFNAVIHSCFDAARASPGVPFLVKDVLATERGQPYHCGLRAARNAGYCAVADSWLVQRYRDAGFASLGRTNTPELATAPTTEPLSYGATRNPWDPSSTPGGSSGGSAAAVASGMVPAAHGNDMGGSIRIPASHCGLVGLKPTRARTSLAPDYGEYWGPVTHQHVLTRSVRDSAAILDATAGPAPGDPYAAPTPPAHRSWLVDVSTDPGRLRVGFRTRLPNGPEAHPDVRGAVDVAAALLESLGHEIVDVALPGLDDAAVGESLSIMFPSVVAREAQRWSISLGRDITGELEPMNAMLAELGRGVSATQWLTGVELIQAWARRMATIWEALDLLLLPVTPDPPLALGELAPTAKEPVALLDDLIRICSFTIPFNLTGEPAISLPLHWTQDGLPVGIQLIAPFGREDRLFQLAGQLEVAQPWSQRRPAITIDAG